MRKKNREITSRKEIRSLLDRAKVVRVGMCGTDGWLYVVPFNFGNFMYRVSLRLAVFLITGTAIVFLMAQPVSAQSILPYLPIPQKYKDYYSDAKQVYDDTKSLYTNSQACLERGGTKEQCAAMAIMCYMQEKAVGKLYPGFVSDLKIFDAFKVADCSDGECYQCCYKPNKGCHTSFVGYPVINCNERYGKGTQPAGLTMFTRAPKPGEACLYIPQTCEHIPLCNYNGKTDISALEQKLKNGTPHALNWKRSVAQRAKMYSKGIGRDCLKYINTFSTEAKSIVSFLDMLMGRGCRNWRSNVRTVYPFKWKDPVFVLKNNKGKDVKPDFEPAMHLNALNQFCTLRVIASIPNIAKRLAFVDSRVWSATSKKQYLAKVKDTDLELKRWLYSQALDIIKKNYYIQDYKLLAIPLANEPTPTTFGGCTLGKPPLVRVSHTQDGTHGVRLTVTVDDPEQKTTNDSGGGAAPASDNSLIVIWGDGRIGRYSISAATAQATVSHTYAQGGRYVVHTVVGNDAGLRGIGGIVVATSSSKAGQPIADPPVFARVSLEDLTAWVATLTGNASTRRFELHAEESKGKSHRIGLTKPMVAQFNKANLFGHLVGHNTAGFAFKKLVVKTFNVGGFATGLREKYFTTSKITFEVYSTEKDAFVAQSIKLTPQMLKVYAKGNSTPLPASSLKTDANGLIKIPIMLKDPKTRKWIYYDRVEIPITSSMFTGFKFAPLTKNWPKGTTTTWKEVKPRQFVRVSFCGKTPVEAGFECPSEKTEEIITEPITGSEGFSETCLPEGPSTSDKEAISVDSKNEPTPDEPVTPNDKASLDGGVKPDAKAKPDTGGKPEVGGNDNLKDTTDDAGVVDIRQGKEGAKEQTGDSASTTSSGCGCAHDPSQNPWEGLVWLALVGLLIALRRK